MFFSLNYLCSSLFMSESIGPFQPLIHEHGIGVVDYRDHPILLLRVQPCRNEPLCPSLATLYLFLHPLPTRRGFGSFPNLRDSSFIPTCPRLAGVVPRHVEAYRLCSRCLVPYLVARYYDFIYMLYLRLADISV